MNYDKIINRLSVLFIGLPFIVFTVFWLRPIPAALFTFIALYCTYRTWEKIPSDKQINALLVSNKKHLLLGALFLSIILFFSGIGSYTFQNLDHLYRNAIFRDLVTKPWPVIYHIKGFGKHIFEGKTTVMTYYLGFFLVPALLGKLVGFTGAKLLLLLWSFLGTVLCFLQFGRLLKTYSLWTLAMFLGWGTLFFVGAFYKYPVNDILHEKVYLWAGMILYADSNIGLIYYTFNQGLTAWLILLFVMQGFFKNQILFWYAMCFFLSPFAFLGMAPFVIYYLYQHSSGSLMDRVVSYFSFENIVGSVAVLALTYVYLSSNQAGQFFQVLHHRPKILLVFYLLSWLFIAALIFPKYKKNGLYWLIIAVLTPLPFFQQGFGIDFPGRLSVPAFFILLVLIIQYLQKASPGLNKTLVKLYLIFCVVCHIGLELGRSIYFTAVEFYAEKIVQALPNPSNRLLKAIKNEAISAQKTPFCIKDFGTLSSPKNEVIWNYMSDTEQSNFYKHLAREKPIFE